VRLGACARRIAAGSQLTDTFGYRRAVIRPDPSLAECRGILAAQSVKPQAATLCEARGLGCVEVDLDLLRGDREPELTLFET